MSPAPTTSRRRGAAPAILIASVALYGAAQLDAVGFVGTPAQRHPPASMTKVQLRAEPSVIAPASKTASMGIFSRLPRDIAALATWPLRLMKMSKVTKEVVEEMKAARGGIGSDSGKMASSTKTLKAFLPSYAVSHVWARTDPEDYRKLLTTSLNVLVDSITADPPFQFDPYHKAIKGPDVDYQQWGNDFFRSMVKYSKSKVVGSENLESIKKQLAAGDNVVLLANHQTEADPQVLSILLELEGYGEMASDTIFLAGHKVTSDPLAIPFSMGRNLLTIFSKKYLNTFPDEEKEVKSARNRDTVTEMQRLFSEGGSIFWVAPSGGRDRKTSPTGDFEPAKFDASSVGLFYLMATKAGKKGKGPKTHFYPLAMWSNQLVPPPDDTKADLGEERSASRAPIALEFGPELDPEALGGRKKFPAAAEKAVRYHYDHIDGLMK